MPVVAMTRALVWFFQVSRSVFERLPRLMLVTRSVVRAVSRLGLKTPLELVPEAVGGRRGTFSLCALVDSGGAPERLFGKPRGVGVVVSVVVVASVVVVVSNLVVVVEVVAVVTVVVVVAVVVVLAAVVEVVIVVAVVVVHFVSSLSTTLLSPATK